MFGINDLTLYQAQLFYVFHVALNNMQANSSWLVGLLIMLGLTAGFLAYLLNKKRIEGQRLKELVDERTRALELESTLINTVFDSIPDVLFCKDLDFKHLRVNKSFETLFKVSRDDVVGKTDVEALDLPESDASSWREWDMKVIQEQKPAKIEELVPDAYGNVHTFETIKTPLIQNGRALGLLGLSRDITERKEFEERLRSASEAKTTFIANMSHEIRTPMNSIVGLSELALESEMEPKTRSYLQKIIENSNWLLHILNDILDISKIESGKMELELLSFDPVELLEQCNISVLPKAIEKGIELSFCIEPFADGKLLLGDPVRLRQILINIISNAIKFTNNGTVKVMVTVTKETENSKTIFFEVKDTGIGMTPDQIDRIFEPFMQADSSITRKYGGTGLGLSIAKNFLEMMGSNLDVESKTGEGSSFSFELTFEAVEFAMSAPENRPLFNDFKKPYFSGEVLVCEDNEMNKLVIGEHLQRVGLDYVIAENGAVGVEMVRSRAEKNEKPFDLILMDIHMPVMDGMEAAEKIIAITPGVPIIAMTANVMICDGAVYRQRGITDYIGKPFSSHGLWECLLKYLKPEGWTARSVYQPETDDEKLQHKLKINFVKDNQNKFGEIDQSIRQGDIKLAYRLIHTLKSSAALIEKKQLQNIAAEIELQLKDDAGNISHTLLRRLESELKSVLDELAPLHEPDTSHVWQGEKIRDQEKARALIDKLEPMLKSRSVSCLDYLTDIRSLPEMNELANQIETYDFKLAIQTLLKLKVDWGMV